MSCQTLGLGTRMQCTLFLFTLLLNDANNNPAFYPNLATASPVLPPKPYPFPDGLQQTCLAPAATPFRLFWASPMHCALAALFCLVLPPRLLVVHHPSWSLSPWSRSSNPPLLCYSSVAPDPLIHANLRCTSTSSFSPHACATVALDWGKWSRYTRPSRSLATLQSGKWCVWCLDLICRF